MVICLGLHPLLVLAEDILFVISSVKFLFLIG